MVNITNKISEGAVEEDNGGEFSHLTDEEEFENFNDKARSAYTKFITLRRITV